MKNLLFSMIFLLASSIVSGKDYDKLIIPISSDLLKDELIRKDVFSILNGKVSENLFEYKTKGKDRFVTSKYKSNGWRFYLEFSEKIIPTKTKNVFDINCSSENIFIDDLRFFHVKYMLRYTPYSISAINKEVVSEFGGQTVTFKIKSYLSKVSWNNYLHLCIEKDGKSLDYVLIIKNSEFHECVISRTS